MIDNYLGILEDSLRKKIAVLDEINVYNNAQEELLKQNNISLDELDKNMDQKDMLIQKLTQLDEGFESLYGKVKDQLSADRDSYKEQIKTLQELIVSVTERSVSIQAQEARNKKLIEDFFSKERGQIHQGRKASKAAYGYYKSMSNSNVVPSQFVDQKK